MRSAVLVTGAAGFIGRRLCEVVRARGGTVRALLRRPGRGPWDDAVTCDLGSDPLPDGALEGVGAIFHLAARVHVSGAGAGAGDAAAFDRVNVEGTRAVVRAALDRAVPPRLVHFSSVKAMGEGVDWPESEATPPAPVTAYGRSKLEGERVVLAASDRGLHATVLRLPLVYGPGERGNLSRMLEAVAGGRFPPLPRVANRRSMVHVDDVVHAALLAAAAPVAGGRTYLVTDGRPHSTRELYEGMCAVSGRTVPGWTVPDVALRALAFAGDLAGAVLRRPLPFDSSRYHKLLGSAWYSDARIRDELGFDARRDLETGLAEMWARRRRR